MSSQILWFGAPFAAVWILALCTPRVRQALFNGTRCISRHPVLWKIPAVFALAYGLFQLVCLLLLHWRMERLPEWHVAPFVLSPSSLLPASVLPALEMLSGVLNCLVPTFPISVPCGFLFLINYRNLASELRRVLCRRLGPAGWLLFAALLLCALCAVLKILPLLLLPELAEKFPLRELLFVSTLINALSFVFEYLLGTCLQVYLLLTAYGWIRGMEFDPPRLLHFAVRRLGFVLKWALVIVTATLALIHLPLLIEAWFTGEPAGWGIFTLLDTFAVPALAVAMIALASVQIRLSLHNDSLRGAIAAHAGFLRRHGFSCLILLAAAASIFFLLAAIQSAAFSWLDETAWAPIATILGQILTAATGGWILAIWVCFYKSCEPGNRPIAF